MKTVIDLSGQITLSYDENSQEFQEALKDYQSLTCDLGSGAKEMLEHVAFYVNRFGTDGMVEGAGYVGYNGKEPTEEPYSGIMVHEGYDDFDFETQWWSDYKYIKRTTC